MKLVILVTLVAAAFAGDTFKITVKTQDLKKSQTDGDFFAAVIDYKGHLVDLGVLDNPKRDDFERGKKDIFKIKSDVTFEKIGCLMIRAASDNYWLPDYVKITSDSDPTGFIGYNPTNIRLSSDTSTDGDKGHLAMLWCAPPYPKEE